MDRASRGSDRRVGSATQSARPRENDRVPIPGIGRWSAPNQVGMSMCEARNLCFGQRIDLIIDKAAFARLCGSAPIPTGSGKTDGRHRLHRGGDRQANSALWRIVSVGWPPTRAPVLTFERRTKEGLSKNEITRRLKRYVARELFGNVPHQTAT